MRTGKTNSVIWAADFLRKKKMIKKTLIAAPLSTLERVWGDTLFIDSPHSKFKVLYGSAQKRRDLLNSEADYYVINHDGIEVIHDELRNRPDIDHIIIDEVSTYRNSQMRTGKEKLTRYGYMKTYLRPDHWIWGMTGTPTPNAPTDGYGQAKLVKPENVNGSFTKFRELTMQQFGPYKWLPRHDAADTVAKILYPSIRFTRDVCTDMEPNIVYRQAELSATQKQHYEQMKKQALTSIGDTQVTAVNAAVMVSKLIQIACGVVYGANGDIAEMDFGPRLKVLEELIEENEEKVLVFVPFTGVLDALARELRKKWTVEVVDGGVAAGKRNKIFSAFQNDENPHIILAHPGCMAHGLELTAASLIIWYAPIVGKNELHEQANARIDGGGQTVKMDIAYIAAAPEEWKAYDVLNGKCTWQQIVLDLIKDH
jgi:SNF2 family DNA or RNA helicase